MLVFFNDREYFWYDARERNATSLIEESAGKLETQDLEMYNHGGATAIH